MAVNKRARGARWEDKAAEYLETKGHRILCRNYRCRSGEIDIIAMDESEVVFTEVKYRSDSSYGTAAEAVGIQKQRTIRRVAEYYLVTTFHRDDIQCRFDVIGFDGKENGYEITHIKNAF